MNGARGRLAFTLGLLALSSGFLAGSLGLSGPARRVPLPVAVFLVALLAVQLGRERRSPRETGPEPAGAAVAWVLALPLAILALGLYAGAGGYVLAFLRVRGRESWTWSLGVAIVAACAVWGLIGGLLGAAPPTGLFGVLGGG